MSNLKLRYAIKEDLDKIVEIQKQNIDTYYMFGNSPKAMTDEDFISEISPRLEKKPPIKGLYVVEQNEGIAGFFYTYFAMHRNGFMHMHFGIKKTLQANVGAEVLSEMLDYCFYELNYNKVNVMAVNMNDELGNVLKKNSFDLEVTFREQYYADGKYFDVYKFGAVKQDFVKGKTYSFEIPKANQDSGIQVEDEEYVIDPGGSVLIGKKVDLTLLLEEDAKIMYEQNLKSDEKNFASLGAAAPSNLDYYKKLVSQYNDYVGLGHMISFAIRRKDGEIAGTIEADSIDQRNKNLMIGLTIVDKANRGLGYGGEAIRMLLDFAFFELNMHRVYLGGFTFNENATKGYEHLGFTVEGTNRGFVYRNGKYYDEVSLGILKNEWIAIKRKRDK